jgi:hypothetical protein
VSVVTRSESADDLVDVLGREPRPTGRIGLTQRSQVEHFGERLAGDDGAARLVGGQHTRIGVTIAAA